MAASTLVGKRVGITRSALQSEELANVLAKRGAVPIVRPLITFSDPENYTPLDTAISALEHFDWLIFTSAQAVRPMASRCTKLGQRLAGHWVALRVAAVGLVTEVKVKNTGLHWIFNPQSHSPIRLYY